MSKLKIRKYHKIYANHYGIIERAGKYHWENRETIRMVTKFECENNSLYCTAINYYETLPFSIHNLWIEIVDMDTSRLMVAWNTKNKKMIKDLMPFWTIYFSLKFEKVGGHMHYFATLDEAMNHLRTAEIKYQVRKLPKEIYFEYRRKISEKQKQKIGRNRYGL